MVKRFFLWKRNAKNRRRKCNKRTLFSEPSKQKVYLTLSGHCLEKIEEQGNFQSLSELMQ